MRELLLEWGGQEYRCRPTYDVIMHIENRVNLAELGQRMAAGYEANNYPISHVSWLMYCLLKSGGAPATAEQVWDLVKSNKCPPDTLGKTIGFLIEEVFGIGPEEEIETSGETEAEGKTAPGIA